MLSKVFAAQVCDLKVVLFLSVLDPRLCLILGIDQEGVTRALGDQDTILGRQVVGWQPLDIPLIDSGIINEKTVDIELFRVRNLSLGLRY
jgi:hypothetical protein